MSWPEEKIGPTPPRMITRTLSSSSAWPMASSRSTSMPRFWAFLVSGRLRRMRTIRPSSNSSYVTYLYSGMSVSPPHPSPGVAVAPRYTAFAPGWPSGRRPIRPGRSVLDAEGDLGTGAHGLLDLGPELLARLFVQDVQEVVVADLEHLGRDGH